MININIENRLKEVAMLNPEYDGLWSTWNLNKQTMQPILNAIIKDYPHYSLHDNSHSDSILSNIERLLGEERIKILSPTDLWLILHVAYLHDFGMVITDSKMITIWKSNEFQQFIEDQRNENDEDSKKAANTILNIKNISETEYNTWPLEVKNAITVLLSKYCRKYHGSMSKDYILDKDIWSLDLGHNGLVKKRLINVIGEISVLHTKAFDDILRLPKTSNGYKNDYMHPRFVSCMLRVGDVLDLDNGRFNEYAVQIFGTFPKESYNHYKKHESTKHVLVRPESIEVEADCPDGAVYRETRKWFESLKDEIENLQLHWNDIAPDEFGRPPKLSSCRLLRNGTIDIYGLSELKLHISQSKTFEILEGSSIYESKLACLRELIQNAEDASKIQLWRDIKKGIYYCHHGINREKVIKNTLTPFDIPSWIYDIYTIKVDIEKTDANNVRVAILDHGTGISIDSLRSICNVGQSYFIKKDLRAEIESMPVWLRPTASFGIGLQSCFMATNQFTIVSKADSSEALRIIFESGKEEGYVNTEIIPNENFRGSKVLIEFDENMNFSYDMFGFTARNIRYLDPFESKCALLYRVIEEFDKTCGNSFFNIDIQAKEIEYSEMIQSYFTEMPNINSEKLLCFDKDNAELNIWYDNSFYSINFCLNGTGALNVYFKGKKVNKTGYLTGSNFIGFDIVVDIYGMQTKQALSLNRDELSRDAICKINDNLRIVIRRYLDLVSSMIESDNNYNFFIQYVLCAWMYEKKMPNYQEQKIPMQNVYALVRNDDKYEIQYISFNYICKNYPMISFIKEDVVKDQLGRLTAITEENLLSDINNNFDNITDDYIIIDKVLCKYLKMGYCKVQYLHNSGIRVYTVNHGDIYNPDQYTRCELIKQLVFNNKTVRNNFCIERRSIPAIKDYEKIAVQINIPFIFSDEASKWKIISPISYRDAEKISVLSEDGFVDYIVKQDVFNKLVDYTLEHAMSNDISRETVISEYKKLIIEYYNIVKK